MAQDNNNVNGIGKMESSFSHTICACLYMLLTDIVLYGSIIPLIGVYLAGSAVKCLGAGPKVEIFLTVFLTFFLVYGAFYVLGESTYWKHLFAFDRTYFVLLQVRDALNVVILAISITSLITVIQTMIEAKGMKIQHVSEGAGYFYLKTVAEFIGVPKSLLQQYGIKLPHSGTISDPNFGENEKYEQGGAFMLFWSMMSACIAKLVYFNTLFTYMRAMEIFLSLKPSFIEEDDDDDEWTVSTNSFYKKPPSQMENDIARAAKVTPWEEK